MATPTPLNMVEKAHQLYREGRFTQALSLYSDSLSIAKTKAQKIALHSNRAACFLKLYDFKQVRSFRIFFMWKYLNIIYYEL